MTNYWYITFRSITFAQKGERLLRRSGLDCTLMRAPRGMSARGCGYCLRLRGQDAMAALELLKAQDLFQGKVYTMDSGGKPEEREL